MTITVNGSVIMFSAIESLKYESEDSTLKVTTRSGTIHSEAVKSKELANKIIEKTLFSIALGDSI